MTRTLPSQHDLEQFETEARNLLHELRRKDAAAVERYFFFDPLAGNSQPGLADAKYVVARQHGFKNWQELRQRVLSAGPDSSRNIPWLFPA